MMKAKKKWILKDFVKLSRPHFLVPGFFLYSMGSLLAACRGFILEFDKFLFGYLIFFFAHLSVSYSNDYFDQETDSRGTSTILSGGSGILKEHPEMAKLSITVALLLLIASALFALAFMIFYDYNINFLIFSILGGWLGWFYSAPPVRLAYRGFGEIATMIAAGLMMPGMGYFVVSGNLDIWFIVISIPLVCYGLFFILTVELPDLETDTISGKRGFLVRFGRKAGAWLSMLACFFGFLIFLYFSISGILGCCVDFKSLTVVSIIPLIAATYHLANYSETQQLIMRQVLFNFGTMIIFLILANIILISCI
ncbi:MAG: prenyltransferase [Methanomassiliicoccales archaeon]